MSDEDEILRDDNVTPMVPIHRCASCHELVEHDKRFEPESHGATCRQPEIRMRRLESRVWEQEKRISEVIGENEELRISLLALARHLLEPGECLAHDAPMYCGGSDLCPCRTDGHFHGTCGINETLVALLQADILEQRKRGVALPWWARVEAKEKANASTESPDTQRSPRAVSYGPSEPAEWLGCKAADSVEQRPDASAAEPERKAPDGAEPAGDAGRDT